jgi:hypothetical protein
MAGLNPHNAWIVFSAPEMTTVSKPNRNPASAETSDQRKSRDEAVEVDEWAGMGVLLSFPNHARGPMRSETESDRSAIFLS